MLREYPKQSNRQTKIWKNKLEKIKKDNKQFMNKKPHLNKNIENKWFIKFYPIEVILNLVFFKIININKN